MIKKLNYIICKRSSYAIMHRKVMILPFAFKLSIPLPVLVKTLVYIDYIDSEGKNLGETALKKKGFPYLRAKESKPESDNLLYQVLKIPVDSVDTAVAVIDNLPVKIGAMYGEKAKRRYECECDRILVPVYAKASDKASAKKGGK